MFVLKNLPSSVRGAAPSGENKNPSPNSSFVLFNQRLELFLVLCKVFVAVCCFPNTLELFSEARGWDKCWIQPGSCCQGWAYIITSQPYFEESLSRYFWTGELAHFYQLADGCISWTCSRGLIAFVRLCLWTESQATLWTREPWIEKSDRFSCTETFWRRLFLPQQKRVRFISSEMTKYLYLFSSTSFLINVVES